MTLRSGTLELAHAAVAAVLADHQRTLRTFEACGADTQWFPQIEPRREITDRYQAALDELADELAFARRVEAAIDSDAARYAAADRSFG